MVGNSYLYQAFILKPSIFIDFFSLRLRFSIHRHMLRFYYLVCDSADFWLFFVYLILYSVFSILHQDCYSMLLALSLESFFQFYLQWQDCFSQAMQWVGMLHPSSDVFLFSTVIIYILLILFRASGNECMETYSVVRKPFDLIH